MCLAPKSDALGLAELSGKTTNGSPKLMHRGLCSANTPAKDWH